MNYKQSIATLFIGAFLLLCPKAYSQRHVKGIKGIEANGGITKLGKYGQIGFSKYLSSKFYYKISGSIEFANYKGIKFNAYSTDLGVYYSPYNYKGIIYININPGITANVDHIRSIETRHNGRVGGGVFLGAELEAYITNKIVFIINAKQKYFFTYNLGNAYYMAGAGLKFTFN